jgi:hypothetical protein
MLPRKHVLDLIRLIADWQAIFIYSSDVFLRVEHVAMSCCQIFVNYVLCLHEILIGQIIIILLPNQLVVKVLTIEETRSVTKSRSFSNCEESPSFSN